MASARSCREQNEPVFHAAWERRLFALSQAVPVAVPFGDDHLRREVERLPPADYLRMSYYEGWLIAIRSLLAERGILPGSAAARIATAAAAGRRSGRCGDRRRRHHAPA